MIGRSLAHYRILDKLGAGGMGEVYLAEDTKLERRVALKVLAPGVAGDPRHLVRFRREARAVAAVNHPGIVTVYSVEEDQGLQFFTMEYVEGASLRDRRPAGDLTLAELLTRAIGLADALAAAHAAGIVHRDLKPGNVMVDARGELKILDFGLAKRAEAGAGSGSEPITRTGALVGTVAYMAPEQIRGRDVDERSDLFSLGVILYEMSCGRHPFDTRDVGRAMLSILHERPRPLSALRPDLGAGLDPILARCLEKEPRNRHPSAAALRDDLVALETLAAERTTSLPAPGAGRPERRSGSRPEIWRLPRPRNRNFCGRDEELEELRRSLEAQAGDAPAAAVVGLGGVGKTDLAVEFAYRFAGGYRTVWWLSADEPTGLSSGYAALGREAGLKPRQDVERTVAEVREWLGGQTNWLLVFDNAEEPSAVRPFLPSEGGGHVLVTSRNPAWRGLGRVLELRVWTAERAAAFLEKRTGDADAAAARELNEALGGLPLALEHAAAYIEASGQSVASYLRLFRAQKVRLLSKKEPVGSSTASVIATWDLSFRRLTRDAPAAEQLLDLSAFLGPDDIPLDLLREAGELLPEPLRGAVEDELALDETLAALLRYSLVSRLEDSLSVHRLVQMAIRHALAAAGSVWLERATRIVSAAFPTGGFLDVRVWPRCSRLLPHALACLGRLDDEAPRATAELLDAVGSYLSGRAQYREARAHLERALAIEEAARGRDHPQVAIRLNDLGRVLVSSGELHEARARFERALAIEEAALGGDHPNVASRLNNIAATLNELGRPIEARPLLERALKIDEAARGSDHPKVAHRLSNLAVTYLLTSRVAPEGARQSDLRRSRDYFDRALQIYRRSFGAENLLVGKAMMNIGNLLIDQGELLEAKRWLEQALGITEKCLGPDHPELARCLKNLGVAHRGLRECAEARVFLDRALAIEQEAFGGRHREQGVTLEDLGMLALEEGSEEEARLCFERALSTLEQTVGAEHRDTARVRGRLQELAR